MLHDHAPTSPLPPPPAGPRRRHRPVGNGSRGLRGKHHRAHGHARYAGAGEIATEATVTVSDNQFTPAELTVEADTSVTWTWDGVAQHNVVGDGFESRNQAQGTFEHTFDAPGTYSYVCTLHQGMDGTVIVVEA